MKKCIISLVLVMVMVVFISMSAHAGGIGLSEDESQCDIGLTSEEKLRMKAAWRIIELIEGNATVWYPCFYVIVRFDYSVYEDIFEESEVKEYLAIMAQAFQYTDDRVIRVFYMNPDGSFVGHADENSKVFLWNNPLAEGA